jgi:O-antigen ligase
MDTLQRRRLVLVWLAAACLVAAYALAQKADFDPIAVYAQAGSRERAMSVFGNPTFLAGFLVLAWPLGLAALGAWPAGMGITTILLMWLALGATQSRAGLLALGVHWGVIIICFLGAGARQASPLQILPRRKTLMLFAGIAVGVLFAVLTYLLLPTYMWTRPTLRLELWKATLDLAWQRPLLGWGPGSFVLGFGEHLTPALMRALTATNQFAEHPHNFVINLLWETGLLGLAAFGAVLFLAARSGWRRMRQAANQEEALWNAALLLGLTGLLVQNLFDRNLKLAGSGFFMWVALGWMSAAKTDPSSPRSDNSVLRRLAGVMMIMAGGLGLWQAAKPLIAYRAVKAEPDVLAQGRENAPQDEAQIRESLKAAPGDARLWQTLGDCLAKQSQFEQAGQAYEKCFQLDPKALGALLNLGNCRFQSNHLDQAEKTFRQAMALDPASVDAHFNLGYTLFYERRMKEAVAEFDEVLRLQPGHAKATMMKEQILH